jgi:peptidoglycan/LPS O-acetylase OafA/YrhL
MASHDVAGHGLWVGNIPARYLMGMIFSIHLVGICWASGLVAGRLRYADKFIRWAAGATFTIYLLHLPVAQFLAALVPWPPADWKTRSLLLVGTPVILVALAEFTERRKGLWIRLFNGIRKLGRNQLHRAHPADAGHTLSQSRSISRTCQ